MVLLVQVITLKRGLPSLRDVMDFNSNSTSVTCVWHICNSSALAPARLHRPPSCTGWSIDPSQPLITFKLPPLISESWRLCHSLLKTDHGPAVVRETRSVWVLRSKGRAALFPRCGKATDWRTQTVAPHFTVTLPQAHSHILASTHK